VEISGLDAKEDSFWAAAGATSQRSSADLDEILRAIPSYNDGDLIIVEATSCQKPDKSTKNVIFIKSFMGGMQMHHQGDETVEYSLDMQESGRYSMTVLRVTVHRDCEETPLLVSFESGDMTSLSKFTIPYTTGMFRETEPVTVELQKGTNTTSFTRETSNYGFTLKCFLFRPTSSYCSSGS
jgi:hypothetical protein